MREHTSSDILELVCPFCDKLQRKLLKIYQICKNRFYNIILSHLYAISRAYNFVRTLKIMKIMNFVFPKV